MITFKVHYCENSIWKYFIVTGICMSEIVINSTLKKKELGIDTTRNMCWSERINEEV